MFKKILSIAVALNLIVPLPLFAQSSHAQLTVEEIQMKLDTPSTILISNNSIGSLIIVAAAIAVGTSINANARLVSKIQAMSEEKLLVKKNPAEALSRKADRLTKSFNKTVKGKKAYAAISRDINLLNRRLHQFSEYAKSFPSNSGFDYIPPDLHPEINKTISSIPKNILKINPSLKSFIGDIKAILRKSAEKMGNKGIAAGIICLSIFLMLPSEAESAVISNSRVQMKRALLTAQQDGPESLTLTALALAGKNKKMVADILFESTKTDNNLYPAIETVIDIITAPQTIAEMKLLRDADKPEAVKAELIKALEDTENNQFKVNFSF